MKRRALALVAALWLALLAPSAQAAPSNNDEVQLLWNGPITALDWRGRPYAVAGDSFVGTPLSVPGDQIKRQATVVNNGPSDAKATVEIIDVTVNTPSGAVNTELQDCVHLTASVAGNTFDATWRQAVDQAVDSVSWSITVPLAKGASLDLSAGAYFPIESTEGRSHGGPSQELSFKVKVTLVGDTPAVIVPPPVVDPPQKIETGGTIQGQRPPWLAFAALAVLGGLALSVRRWTTS